MRTFSIPVLALSLLLPMEVFPQATPPVAPKEEVSPRVTSPVAPVAAPVPEAPPATYTVKAGDNPWTIARNLGISHEELLKINEIKDPKNLKIGDVLKLPAGAKASASPATAPGKPKTVPPVPAAPSDAGWEYYTIQKGDNPWKIAKALKVEHRKIVSLNEGVDFTKLKIGQQIKVPKKL